MKLKLHEKILVCIFLVIGFSFLLYPTVSRWFNNQRVAVETESYEANVGNLSDEEIAIEWKKAREYNENLRGDPVHDPFIPGSGSVLPENYLDCLNINGMIGNIEIPKINIKLPIYHGTSESTLKNGIGHIESSALPTGDKGCHPILTGHTGLPEAKLFTDLTELEIGDKFYIDVLGEIMCYQVDQIKVILPEELNQLAAYQDHDYVTLLTCTPYGINSHRLLVRGERVPYVEADKIAATDQFLNKRIQFAIKIILVLILLIIMLFVYKYLRKKRIKIS